MAKDVCCNICGKKMDEWDLQEDFTIHKKIGYGSRFDGDEVCLRLCCQCMDNMIEGCVENAIVLEEESDW